MHKGLYVWKVAIREYWHRAPGDVCCNTMHHIKVVAESITGAVRAAQTAMQTFVDRLGKSNLEYSWRLYSVESDGETEVFDWRLA